jgi:predicted RNase H-like HicB family nuclease
MMEALRIEEVEDYTYRDLPEPHSLSPIPPPVVTVLNERVLALIEQVSEEVRNLPPLPMQLIEKYADLATRHAILKQGEDGEWFATIPGFPGVWAKEATEERVLEVLREVVEGWALLKIQHKHRDLPELDEINLNVL